MPKAEPTAAAHTFHVTMEGVRTKTAIGVGNYSLRDAAMLLHMPYGKLRRWAAGYWYSAAEEERFSEPVVPGEIDELDERVLSFYELMELFVIGFFRREGVSMPVVRAARAEAQALFGVEYPFAMERLNTDGRGIFGDLLVDELPEKRLKLELSKSQIAFSECVEPFFRTNVDYRNGLASTYWPLGRDKPVLLDARRSFGRPIVVRTGTPTFALYAMHKGGEEHDRITAWYDVTHEELDTAIEYEDGLRVAA
ncbi:MAG TPA: DUF433 domain-containing protein [Candidatus Elarobacter sp.]|jgi:uncharacterized protein (DUF433 family)